MAIEWYDMTYSGTNIVSVGVDWNITSNAKTSYSIAPLIYRWDKQNSDNYGSKWSESLSPDPVGAGSWSGLSWGSGSGSRQIDSFATRTYTKTTSTQTVTLKISWDSSFGSYYSGAFRTLGSGSHTWTLTIPALDKVTITFNANGGSGGPSTQSVYYGTSTALSSTIPTRTGYTFLGWSTSSTATSASYSAGSKYSFTAATTLYAVWKIDTYAVSYNANGGSGAPSNQTKTHGTALTLSSTIPTRNGYDFLGWATSATGSVAYQPGSTYTSNAALSLYAIWEAHTYTITYDANGGSGAPATQTKTHDVSLTLSSQVPIREGYEFLGWGTSAEAAAASYSPGRTYTAESSIILYAIWSFIPVLSIS